MPRTSSPLLAARPPTFSGVAEQALFREDIEKLRQQFPGGRCHFSREWVLTHVAPDKRRRMSRGGYWLRRDVEAWHARGLRNELTPDEQATSRRLTRYGFENSARRPDPISVVLLTRTVRKRAAGRMQESACVE